MEETYNLTAIILNRRPFAEDDCRVTVYSRERGRLELVARGARKIRSKLAGHLEPLCLTDIMAARGRQYDYAAAAASKDCFNNIKSDLNKLMAAGQAIRILNSLVKAESADQNLFKLLAEFLGLLNQKRPRAASRELWVNFFTLKVLIALGYKPEIYHCLDCRKKIEPDGNKFDINKGGLVCKKCWPAFKQNEQLVISANGIKVLRLAASLALEKMARVKLEKKAAQEAIKIISSFLKYNFENLREEKKWGEKFQPEKG